MFDDILYERNWETVLRARERDRDDAGTVVRENARPGSARRAYVVAARNALAV